MLRYFTSQAPRWAPIVDIRGAFMHAGHLCLVLERLGPSLLDYTVSSAGLPLPQQLLQLRKIAHQLLVRLRMCASQKNRILVPSPPPPPLPQAHTAYTLDVPARRKNLQPGLAS